MEEARSPCFCRPRFSLEHQDRIRPAGEQAVDQPVGDQDGVRPAHVEEWQQLLYAGSRFGFRQRQHAARATKSNRRIFDDFPPRGSHFNGPPGGIRKVYVHEAIMRSHTEMYLALGCLESRPALQMPDCRLSNLGAGNAVHFLEVAMIQPVAEALARDLPGLTMAVDVYVGVCCLIGRVEEFRLTQFNQSFHLSGRAATNLAVQLCDSLVELGNWNTYLFQLAPQFVKMSRVLLFQIGKTGEDVRLERRPQIRLDPFNQIFEWVSDHFGLLDHIVD